jgi:hypothetical protein
MELDRPHRRIEVRLEYLKSALTLALSRKRARGTIHTGIESFWKSRYASRVPS